ncbi:MAG: Bifunctional oligoribonuclease and PAP phosphatase NrnA [Firmicutes bacterium ADurb.Bin182]|nr:MAG: Bifunctional oligoribonuclease and PAP phosphatase NrnA [Firmicutes bacterium ADurb.Bin182]
MLKKPRKVLIPITVLVVFLCAVIAAGKNTTWTLASMAISVIALVSSYFYISSLEHETQNLMDDVFSNNTIASARIINKINLPCLIFDDNGRIVWGNEAFKEIYSGSDIKKILPSMDPRSPNQAQILEMSGKTYQLMSIKIVRERESKRKMTFQYWLDITEARHYSRLYEEQMPTVALIYVDNYEELNADSNFQRSAVLTEVERMISNFVSSVEGIYRKYDNSRFIVIFEAKRLAEMEKQRFSLLDGVREIETGIPNRVTLSIAVGVASRIEQSDKSARQAMELALGRGGDQAVIKRGTSYLFYGGKRQVAARQSKVKIRLFAKALRQLMENSSDVYIMGHRQPDMDCIGASLALFRCAEHAGRKASIVLDEPNPTIREVLSAMQAQPRYENILIHPDAVKQSIRYDSILVILDTQRVSSVIEPELAKMAGKIVVIDHHRRSLDSVENVTLNYLEAGASSACEIMTEVLQYFDESIKPTEFEAGVLLAGITIDTKNFAFNTGSRTFEAAGYLRRHGADTGMVKEMNQDDMTTFVQRARVVENAEILENGIALAVCDEAGESAALIAAQAADSLITIKGIQASFVLAQYSDMIVISGRSLGSVNVQVILERMGGGGHLTAAGAQLKNTDMDSAVRSLKEIIRTYFEEVVEK